MCTFIYQQNNQSLAIAMNRDEHKSRTVVGGKNVLHEEGSLVYPIADKGKSTWFGLNLNNIVLGLLNYYPQGYSKVGVKKSRGLIIPQLLSLKTLEQVNISVNNLCLLDYRPFRLIVCSKKTKILYISDGMSEDIEVKKLNNQSGIIISSSKQEPEAIVGRKEIYSSFKSSDLFSKHCLKNLMSKQVYPQNESHKNIFVQRENVATLATSIVELNNEKIIFNHFNYEGKNCVEYVKSYLKSKNL